MHLTSPQLLPAAGRSAHKVYRVGRGNRDMTIRNAEVGDLDAIADLAQDQRLRQQAWAPTFWALAPNAREVHPLFLRVTLGSGRSIALVASVAGRVAGFVIASPLSLDVDTDPTWVVDDVGVAAPNHWDRVGRALLAAVAGRAHRLGATRIVVPCAVADRMRRAALVAAGLDLNCWYRHRRLDVASALLLDEPDDEPGLPLPHLHGLSALAITGAPVAVPGGQALLSPPIAPPPVYRPGGTTGLADPVVAGDTTELARLVAAVETQSRDRGDVALLVVAGPGEEPLDALLDRRGYDRPVEWWVLRPRA